MNPQTTQMLHDLVSRKIVPGVSYAMLHHGQLQAETFGARQLIPEKQPLLPGLYYDVASLTKVVGTTPVILQLVETGQIGLDQEIKQLLPRFQDDNVTIRHLLTHTSAIGGYISNRDQLDGPDLLTAIYQQLHSGPLLGKKVVYSDINMILLGQIIERFYKRPVQDVITSEVLKPLGLTESTFRPPRTECVPTEFDPQRGGVIQGSVHDPKAASLGRQCGSAGLFMTLNDLLKYCQWLLGQFRPNTVLSEKTILSLFADQTTLKNGGRSLGFDLRYTPQGTACLYHTGFTGTFLLVDRKEQDVLAVLTNRIHPSAANLQFLKARDQLVLQYLREKGH